MDLLVMLQHALRTMEPFPALLLAAVIYFIGKKATEGHTELRRWGWRLAGICVVLYTVHAVQRPIDASGFFVTAFSLALFLAGAFNMVLAVFCAICRTIAATYRSLLRDPYRRAQRAAEQRRKERADAKARVERDRKTQRERQERERKAEADRLEYERQAAIDAARRAEQQAEVEEKRRVAIAKPWQLYQANGHLLRHQYPQELIELDLDRLNEIAQTRSHEELVAASHVLVETLQALIVQERAKVLTQEDLQRAKEEKLQEVERETQRQIEISVTRNAAIQYHKENAELLASLYPYQLFYAELMDRIPAGSTAEAAWKGARALIAKIQGVLQQEAERKRLEDENCNRSRWRGNPKGL